MLKRGNIKQILSVLVAVAMILGSLSSFAYAEGTHRNPTPEGGFKPFQIVNWQEDGKQKIYLDEAGTGYVEGKLLVEGEDLEDAVIIHEQKVEEAYLGSTIEVEARVMDDVSVTEVELLVQPEGKTYWYLIPMDRVSGNHKDGIYKGTISSDMISGNSIRYRIRARDFSGEATITPDYIIRIIFGVKPGEYVQGFEDMAIGWVFNGDWSFGKAVSGVDPEPYEGEGLAGTVLGGNYRSNARDWMITPPIDLRDATLEEATIRFHHWYNIETNYDNGFVYATNDYGQTWNLIGGPYTGASQQWNEVVISLDEYIGSEEPVFVGFYFTSDNAVNRIGWYIDNVRIVGKDLEPPQSPENLTVSVSPTGIKLEWAHLSVGDLSHYNIYRSEVSGDGYVKIGETVENTFKDIDLVPNTTYYYVVTAEDLSGNESPYSVEVSVMAPEVVTLFFTDFEDDNGGFTTNGTNNCWEWGVPTSGPNAAYSGEKLWATKLNGDYNYNFDGYIESPPIEIPEDKLPYLIFTHWYNTENRYDYGNVQVSSDGGQTWQIVSPNYTNVSNGWITEEIALNQYVGTTIKIRFFFHSDMTQVRAGWYIDDVTVKAMGYTLPEEEVLKYDDGTAENATTMNQAGYGLAVRFTPTLYGKLTGADIYLWGNDWPQPGGNRLGFAVYEVREDGRIAKVGETIYVDNLTRGGWNHIDLSQLNFFTDKDFYISTIQDREGSYVPGTGIDENSPYGSRSYANIIGQMQPFSSLGGSGAVMIRAHMNYTFTPEEGSRPQVELVEEINVDDREVLQFAYGEPDGENRDDSVIPEPDYKIIDETNPEYEIVYDEEIENIPMSRGFGIPVDEATITVLETGTVVNPSPVNGEYRIALSEGTYTLRAESYGYIEQEIVVEVRAGEVTEQSFFLPLKPRNTIRGRIFDRYSKGPVVNALVRLVEDNRVQPVTTDDEGTFVMPNVLIGTYTLKVTSGNYEPAEFTVVVEEEEEIYLELELRRYVGYEEQIIYDDGTAENRLVSYLSGYPVGLAVRFTPEKPGLVKGLNIYLWDESFPTPGGNRLGFAIYDILEDGTAVQIGEPVFRDDLVRGAWNYIDLTSIGFIADGDFYISTVEDMPYNYVPATGIDTSSKHNDRMYLNVRGSFVSLEGVYEGCFMMRAVMKYEVSIPEITNLAELNYTNQDSITVEGTVSKDAVVNVYVNGEKSASAETKGLRFAIDVDLPQERNEIMATLEIGGMETEPSPKVVVIKDQALPTLTVIAPEDGLHINNESVEVAGNVVDNYGIAELIVKGESVPVDEEGNFRIKVLVDEGENTIEIRAIDFAGNETIVQRRVYVELEAPGITNIQPDEDITLTAGDVLTVSFNGPPGGEGYFNVILPFGTMAESIGLPMEEVEEGLYVGTWTAPEGMEAYDMPVEVIYISPYGNMLRRVAEGRVTVIPGEEEIPEITNIEPSQDVELYAGDVLTVSFNAPEGGEGYFRLILPLGSNPQSIGVPMDEVEAGFYRGTWTVPEGFVATGLQVEVIFIGRDGTRLSAIAEGRVTIIGNMEDLPANTVIVNDKAFDINYLNNSPEAQSLLIQWINAGNMVFIKLEGDTIVDMYGQLVDLDLLPPVVYFYFSSGNIGIFSR